MKFPLFVPGFTVRIPSPVQIRKNIILLKQNTPVFLAVLIGTVVVDSFAFPHRSDMVFFGVTAVYITFIKFTGADYRLTIRITLGLVGLMFLSFVSSGGSASTEKLAVWFFLFLTVGIIQGWKE